MRSGDPADTQETNMAEVSMDYGVVENMAAGFNQAAETLETVNRALETAAGILRATAFLGMIGNLALAEYLDNIQPHVARLAATCGELNGDLLGAVASLRDGDLSGSQRFAGGGSGAGLVGLGGAPGATPPVAGGSSVSVASYTNGQNGWNLVPMSGDFTPGELVGQTGPSCTLFGTMNLLIENGYDISQAQADQILKQHQQGWDWGVMIDMLDGKQDNGFSMGHAEQILDQYDADYDHGDFSTWLGLGSPDRGEAEQFLVKQVQSGHPVLVTTEVDDSFGIAKGGHTYTVLGVQTDSGGKLTNVLVATNWNGQQTWQIPAKNFMDDWMDWNDGEYIVVEKD
jgi:hypothetical protein